MEIGMLVIARDLVDKAEANLMAQQEVGNSRELSIALTHLQTARLWLDEAGRLISLDSEEK
jgi:hypothetical protein